MLKILGLVFLVVIGFVVFSAMGTMKDYSRAGLPKCDSDTAEDELKRTMQESPIGKTLGLQIVLIDLQITTHTASDIVECAAFVTLNNTRKHRILYTFTKQPKGQYLIEYRIPTLFQ
jgi:hypothetical protein